MATVDQRLGIIGLVVGHRRGVPKWVAMHLPHRIALWTFIRVYGKAGQALVTTTWTRR